MMIRRSVPSPMYMARVLPGACGRHAPDTLLLLVRQCSATWPPSGSSGSPASSQATIPPASDQAS
jgi:hypothetical protein